MDVAGRHAGTPSRSGRAASQRLRARSWRQKGRCSSTRKRSVRRRPGASARAPPPTVRRPRALALARRRRPAPRPERTRRGRRAPRVRLERSRAGGGGEGLATRDAGGCRHAPRSAGGRGCASLDGDSTRTGTGGSVRPAVLDRQLRAHDRPHPERLRRLRELHRAPDAVMVGDRERRVACAAAAAASSSGCEAPSRNEKPEWQCSSTRAQAHARCEYQDPRSRKTTSQRPSGQRELEVVARDRPLRPPAVLDQPLLAHRLDRHRGDGRRPPILAGLSRRWRGV